MPNPQYTLVCINPDTTLSVFLSMYQSRSTCSVFLSVYQFRYNLLSNSILSTRELILNPDTTLSVILRMYQSR